MTKLKDNFQVVHKSDKLKKSIYTLERRDSDWFNLYYTAKDGTVVKLTNYIYAAVQQYIEEGEWIMLKKEFEFDDIKTHMRVVTRNGETNIVHRNETNGHVFLVDKRHQQISITKGSNKYRNAKLTHPFDDEFDIIEVYAAPDASNHVFNFEKKGDLLWSANGFDRQEITDEIAAVETEISELEKSIEGTTTLIATKRQQVAELRSKLI